MIEDAAIDAELLDNNFFYYREDADLSWRCQLLGWRCLYAPRAVGHHVRRVLPTNRRSLPTAINLHSTKNRFLMRINNITAGVYGKVAVAATIRDLGILIYLVLFERSSLPGLLWIMRNFRKLMSKRRVIIERARTSDSELKRWFSSYPVSIPLEAVLREQLENIPVVVPSTTSS
jgi:GT2 family glycosyltransferase